MRFVSIRIDFVHGKKNRFFCISETFHQFVIGRCRFCCSIKKRNNQICFFKCHKTLFRDRLIKCGTRLKIDAAAINENKFATRPKTGSIESISSDSRLIVDNGLTFSGKTVKKTGFPDIGTADDSYEGFHKVRTLILLFPEKSTANLVDKIPKTINFMVLFGGVAQMVRATDS